MPTPFFHTVYRWLRDLDQILFPRRCAVCGDNLQDGEDILCTRCLALLPYTQYRGQKGNRVERMFYYDYPVARANAFMFYQKGSASAELVHDLKYRNNAQCGEYMGKIMANEIKETDFFDGIDAIIPIPLHAKRQRERGYNQSEMLARGIAQVTKLPVWTNVVERVVNNPSLTTLRYNERREQTAGIFRLVYPERIRGKHILLVDDVITEGATLCACMDCICKECAKEEISPTSTLHSHMDNVNDTIDRDVCIPQKWNVTFSILTLAVTQYHSDIPGFVHYDFEV